MSSRMRDNARSLGETSFNGIVRRMVSVPRNILGGVSRVLNQGIDLMENIGSRRNHHHQPNFHFQPPLTFPSQDLSNTHHPMINEEWAFLESFEQQYGTMHPFFYPCRLMDALKIAQDEHKFMFMYIHSPEHPFTRSFCRETLCSELVVQFLDANFVSWGGIASRGEGLHMATSIRASSFPFCAAVAPAAADNLAVLQQIEGPVSPDELVEILQKTLEEQGLAFGSGRAKQEEKRRADHRLRQEQDAAYLTALQIDQEKERLKNNSISSENKVPKQNRSKQNSGRNVTQPSKMKPTVSSTDRSGSKKAEEIPVLIRFPNGERREHSFSCTDKIQVIYRYVDSLGVPGVDGNYRLISNFPRKVYGIDQMRMTLKEAGLQPKASLFLEPL